MLNFIVQHPIQSVLILFVILGVLAYFEIWFRRVFNNTQTYEENGLKITRKGRAVEITDDNGTHIQVGGGNKGKVTINGKTVEF